MTKTTETTKVPVPRWLAPVVAEVREGLVQSCQLAENSHV
jgi:hypothetical protein